jgi:hypothetical protein
VNLPIEHSEGSGLGAGIGTPISVGGIRSTSTILAVITRPASTGGPGTGRDPAAFAVATGSISSGTIDTTGLIVYCVWQG